MTSTRLPAADLVLVGTHPTSPLTGFRTIHTLKAFEGRIYLGYGDWNVFPAVVVVSYDPRNQSFHLEFSPPSVARQAGANAVELTARGEIGRAYDLQVATELPANWTNLFRFRLTAPATNLVDPISNVPQHFYRLDSEPDTP